MKTLKLEHLAIAFANKQKVLYYDDERVLNQVCNIVELREEEMTISNGEYQYDVSFDEVKLVLKQLSDLINNILDDGNDENYKLSCELEELLNTNNCSHFLKALIENKYYVVDVRLWNDIEVWFNKNHFDWKYNLIQDGLAVDKNTIEL